MRNLEFSGKKQSIVSKFILATVLFAGFNQSGFTSLLDNDYYCRVYGCLMVGDGSAFDVYDVYIFSTGGVVPNGAELIHWSGNPIDGAGNVDLLVSGTQNIAVKPGVGQGLLVGLDQTGNALAEDAVVDTNGSGYLDLGDSMASAQLSSMTSVVLKDRAFKHSIYVASRTDFDIYGHASLLHKSTGFAGSITEDNTGFQIFKVQQGSDDGIAFGSAASDPRFIAISGINNLSNLWGAPTTLASFRRANGTHRRRASTLMEQSVRIDFEYQLPIPDFSLGVGVLDYQVEYSFHNR